MRRLVTFLALCLCGAAFAQGAPSFDCRKADTDVEKAICTDRTLSALDARMARDYAAKLRQLPPEAAATLREHQRWFIGIRDARYDAAMGEGSAPYIASMKASLEQRLHEIARIATRPATDFDGTWSSPMGAWWVVRKARGHYAVTASTVEQVTARWICDTNGIAHAEHDGTLLLDGNYRLSRKDNVLTVQRIGKDDSDHNCGMNGTLEGDYLLTTEDPRARPDAAR